MRFASCLSLLLMCVGCSHLPTDPATPLDIWAESTWSTDSSGLAALEVIDDTGRSHRLAMTSLEVEVQITGRVARTQVTQVFQNNLAGVMEGIYTFQLPPRAAIRRLAMDVEGVMTEGEIVEREKARQIYDGIVRRRGDPALLEWDGGGRFTTRIFPIPAQGTKTVIVTYEEIVPENLDGRFYRYQLPRWQDETGSVIGRFSLSAHTDTPAEQITALGYPTTRTDNTLHIEVERFVPRGPLDLRLPRIASPRLQTTERGGERFFVLEVPMDVEAPLSPRPEHLIVALDSSASIDPKTWKQVRALVEALDDGPHELHLLSGDLHLRSCASQAPKTCLQDLEPGGASNLEQLIHGALELQSGLEEAVVVVITDGRATLGPRIPRLLGESRVHAVALGPAPDLERLEAMLEPVGGHVLRVPPPAPPESVARVLLSRIRVPRVTQLSVVQQRGELTWLRPPRTLALGESLVLVGRVEARGELAIRARVGEREVTRSVVVEPSEGNADPAPRSLWARGQLDAMQRQGATREAIVEHSIRFGVMSPYTSLIVLENEKMYEDNAIERRKKAEHQSLVTQGVEEHTPEGAAESVEWRKLVGDEPDSDFDGIPDTQDACPLEPEDFNGRDDEDGCPDSSRVVITSSRIEVREHVYFPSASAQLSARSHPILDAVAEVMQQHPHITLVALEGHTDASEGKGKKAIRLSEERAQAVLTYLVQRGVDPARLIIVGRGETRPLTVGRTDDDKARNRRVEFFIVEMDGQRQGTLPVEQEVSYYQSLEHPAASQTARLIRIYIADDRAGDALALLETELVRRDTATERFELLELVRDTYFPRYEVLALELLEADQLNDGQIQNLFHDWLRRGELDAIRTHLAGHPPEAIALRLALLVSLESYGHHALVNALLMGPWTGELSVAEHYALARSVGLEHRPAEYRYTLALEVLEQGWDEDPEVLSLLVEASLEVGRQDEALTVVIERCSEGLELVLNCTRWLDALPERAESVELRSQLVEARLKYLATMRRVDVQNTQHVAESVELLEGEGREEEALRVLSEWVEHAPEHAQHWELYIQALYERGHRQEALEAEKAWARFRGAL